MGLHPNWNLFKCLPRTNLMFMCNLNDVTQTCEMDLYVHF